jgi:hypothetical protein
MKSTQAEGKGAASLYGRLIDYSSVRQAEVLVDKARQVGGMSMESGKFDYNHRILLHPPMHAN